MSRSSSTWAPPCDLPRTPDVHPAVRELVARLRRLLDAVERELPATLSERTGAVGARGDRRHS